MISIQYKKLIKFLKKDCHERFYRRTAPIFSKILTYFLKKKFHSKNKSIHSSQYDFFFQLNLPSCLIPKWHSIAQNYLPVMWTSLARAPAASRDQPNHCTSFRCHLTAAGGTGALLWFIRAPFWAPFNSAYQIKQKKCKTSILWTVSPSQLNF